jgi:hypothetical protein
MEADRALFKMHESDSVAHEVAVDCYRGEMSLFLNTTLLLCLGP